MKSRRRLGDLRAGLTIGMRTGRGDQFGDVFLGIASTDSASRGKC